MGQKIRIDSMGTTAAMLAFGEDMIYGCNLGDSRIYRSSCEKFGQISEDHTLGRHFLGKAPLDTVSGNAGRRPETGTIFDKLSCCRR